MTTKEKYRLPTFERFDREMTFPHRIVHARYSFLILFMVSSEVSVGGIAAFAHMSWSSRYASSWFCTCSIICQVGEVISKTYTSYTEKSRTFGYSLKINSPRYVGEVLSKRCTWALCFSICDVYVLEITALVWLVKSDNPTTMDSR